MATTHVLDFLCPQWIINFDREFLSYVFALEIEDDYYDTRASLTAGELAEAERILGPDFTQNVDTMGENMNTSRILNPATGIEHTTVRVEVNDTVWNACDQAEVVALLKARAEAFFPACLSTLRPAGIIDNAFQGLVYTEVVATSSSTLM